MEEHHWVAACTVPVSPTAAAKIERYLCSDRQGRPKLPTFADVPPKYLDLYCDLCGVRYGRATNSCAGSRSAMNNDYRRQFA